MSEPKQLLQSIQLHIDCRPRGDFKDKTFLCCHTLQVSGIHYNAKWLSPLGRESVLSAQRESQSVRGGVFFSQRHCVVGGKQAAFPPQPPSPPRRVGAIQQLDDVTGAEAQFVALLRAEVVERLHLLRGRPLWDGGRTPINTSRATHQLPAQWFLKKMCSCFIYKKTFHRNMWEKAW